MFPVTQLLIFLVALGFLVKSADSFVHYAARIARRFGVSEFVIGLTLVALGTSLPELANALLGSLRGESTLVLGNIIGANVANMCVAIGLSAFLANVWVQPKFYRRELQVLAVATALFVFAAADGTFTRIDGLILLVSFAIYLQLVTKVLFDFSRLINPQELSYFVEHLANIRAHIARAMFGKHKPANTHWNKNLALDALGLSVSALIIVIASDQLVARAVELAKLFGTSSAGVGATIVSLGTTMPELSVSLASVRRGYYHMLFGNIIGSNIVNLLLIGGVAALVQPYAVPVGVLLSLVLLAVATLACIAILTRPGHLSRVMSASMLGYYVVFVLVTWFAA